MKQLHWSRPCKQLLPILHAYRKVICSEEFEEKEKKLSEERGTLIEMEKRFPARIASLTSYTKNISYDTQEDKKYIENRHLVYSQSLWEGNDECIASRSNFKRSVELE